MPYREGTCRDCGGQPEQGKTRCKTCAATRREREAQRRAARSKAGQCLVCAKPVAKTRVHGTSGKRLQGPARYCREHLAYYATRRGRETNESRARGAPGSQVGNQVRPLRRPGA